MHKKRIYRKYRQYLFIQRLTELMKENNFNQTTLAKASFTSRKTINEYVTGKKEPKNEYQKDGIINSIAKVFNVDVEYLLGMTEYKTGSEYYLDHLDEEIENVENWCVDRVIEKRFQKEFPNFHKEKFTEEELAQLRQQLIKLIGMELLNFENKYKKRNDQHE